MTENLGCNENKIIVCAQKKRENLKKKRPVNSNELFIYSVI